MKTIKIVILLLLISHLGMAQEIDLKIQQHSNITNTPINSIIVDYSNNIWIGTEGELYRINNEATDAVLIKEEGIAAAVFGENERGWIATYDNKIQLFEQQFNYSTNVPSNEIVTSMEVNGECLWVGSTNGLYRISLKTKKDNQSFFAKNSKLPSNRINDIFVDGFENKWIATEEGLAQLREDNWKVHLKSKNVTALEFHKNALYAAADGQMWRYKNSKWEELTLPDEMKTSPIEDMEFDKTGNLWLACGLLGRLDKNWIPYVYGGDDGFESNHPTKIAVDLRGNIWVGTAGKGIYTVSPVVGGNEPIAFARVDSDVPPINMMDNVLKEGVEREVESQLLKNKLVKSGKTISTKRRLVRVALWNASDHKNDRISVYYNNKLILKNYKLKKKRKHLLLRVRNNKENQLIIFAHSKDQKDIKRIKVALTHKDQPQHWMTLISDHKFCDEIRFEHVR